jgi:hypothetical protein
LEFATSWTAFGSAAQREFLEFANTKQLKLMAFCSAVQRKSLGFANKSSSN